MFCHGSNRQRQDHDVVRAIRNATGSDKNRHHEDRGVQCKGETAIPVHREKASRSRAAATRLRHDPDKIMWAKSAILKPRKSPFVALTAPWCLPTVHAQQCVDVVSASPTGRAILQFSVRDCRAFGAKRLIESGCFFWSRCGSHGLAANSVRRSQLSVGGGAAATHRRVAGCQHCRGSG